MPCHRAPATLAVILGALGVGHATAISQDKPVVASPGATVMPGKPCPPPSVGTCPPTVIHYAPTVSFVPGPFGLFPYAPPLIVAAGPIAPIVAVPPGPIVVGINSGPIVPPPPMFLPVLPPPVDPLEIAAGQGAPAGIVRVPDDQHRAPDDDRMDQLLTFGDRNFRAGDLHRADRRYRQALAASPLSAEPRARLAEVAFVRGAYHDAADLFREAITADPGWLVGAGDVQSLFAEPADFHAPLSELEAHLQANPGDRDGWLVLGAQLYLSGRVDRASDVFLRLADHRRDAVLSTLMRASGADR